MEMKIGAAYVRVSTDLQEEYSPDSQLKLIREYAKRSHYIIPDEYVFQDDGISGKRADKRPAFLLMIAQAKQSPPPFDSIFVWKYSRFARNQEESLVYKNMLKKNGVAVVSISEPSSDSPYSSLIESIIAWMDEFYLINLAEEVRRGMKEKASRGEAMGTPPFGYDVKDKVLVPNDDAETIRYIFERYNTGVGCRAIAQELAERGIKTRRGNVPDNRFIKYILQNETYIGKIRWSTNGHANYSRANYAGDNVMVVDGKHPAIIDKETWDAAQARLRARDTETKYVRRNKPRNFMLKGLIRCGDCGSTLVMGSAACPSLQCHRYAKGQCRVSHGISVEKANAAVLALLEDCVRNDMFTFSPPKPKKNKPVRDWDRLIASEEQKLRRARDALLDGVFTPSEYAAVKADVSAAIDRLRIAQEADKEPARVIPDDYGARVLSVLEILRSPDTPDEEKNRALRGIVDKIVFIKPQNTLDVFFAP